MRRLEHLVYAGAPGEQVTVSTQRSGGAVRVEVDGVQVGDDTTFHLKPNSGDETIVTVTLFGPQGASCVVKNRVVDGGADVDFLICQPPLDPAPQHRYRFITAGAMELFAAAPAKKATKKAAKKARRKRPKKNAG